MWLIVFDKDGIMFVINDFFSVGGGFVVNGVLFIVVFLKSVIVFVIL